MQNSYHITGLIKGIDKPFETTIKSEQPIDQFVASHTRQLGGSAKVAKVTGDLYRVESSDRHYLIYRVG